MGVSGEKNISATAGAVSAGTGNGEVLRPVTAKMEGLPKPYLYLPVEVAQRPASGNCYADFWWIAHPEHGLAFYMSGGRLAPQCNRDRSTAEHLMRRLAPGHVLTHMPVVFISHAERYQRAALSKATQPVE